MTAKHRYVAELPDGVGDPIDVDRKMPVAVIGGGGCRPKIASSVLLRNGFEHVHNVPGSNFTNPKRRHLHLKLKATD